MLLLREQLSSDRIDFDRNLSPSEVEQIVSDPRLQVLQCSTPIEPETWDLLNEALFTRRPEIELRVYGFYTSVCDLSFVDKMTNVRRFSADCLIRARGLEHLAALEQLEELSIGVYHLESFDFLRQITTNIKTLSLTLTKSKKPRLDHLSRFQSLHRLYLEGQQRGIEVLSDLPKLEKPTLRSISTPHLDYIVKCPRLWFLAIKLGGIDDLSAIANNKSIKYLELWQVRGLANISVISSLRGLQFLFLQSLKNLTSVADLSKLTKLRKLHLENMKGLQDISAICHASALEEFTYASAQNMAPEKFENLLLMSRLKRLGVGFGTRRKNEKFARQVLQAGKSTDYTNKLEFQFQ